MWLLFPFCFGLLVRVQGHVFKELDALIPKTDLCFLELIKCDDFKSLLVTSSDEYEFFTDAKSLQLACRRNARFIQCIKDSIKLCKAVPPLPEAVKLIETRGFAQVFCSPNSPWQRLYLESANCVNTYAPAAEDVCISKSLVLLRGNSATEVLQFCQSSVAMRECFVRIVQKTCGIIAGDLLNRVVMYGTGDDFLCNKLEGEMEKVLQEFWFSPKRNYDSKNDKIARLFLSDDKNARKLSKPIEVPPIDIHSTTELYESTIADEIPVITEVPQFDAYLEEETDFATTLGFGYSEVQEQSSFTETSSSEVVTHPPSIEYKITLLSTTASDNSSSVEIPDISSLYPPEETYSYKNFTSFGLYEVMDNGDEFFLGCGTATVLWTTDLKLKNVLCGWVNAAATHTLFKCSIHLDEACLFSEKNENYKKEINMDSRKIMLVVFSIEKGNYREVATMKVRYFKPDHNALTLADVMGEHFEGDVHGENATTKRYL